MAPVSIDEQRSGVIGIIYPPPEVRNIVDKTASFVARNGPEFEQRIKQNEVNNPKFNFLNSGDPYHAYYLHKVGEIRDGKIASEPSNSSAVVSTTAPSSGSSATVASGQALAKSQAIKQRQSDLLKQVQREQEAPPPSDPPPDYEFIADPPSISAFDLDVVKLTAQFVARNGRQFLTNLMNREQRNYQFDFLRPQHSLFQYFTKLLEQYTKVLIPSKDVLRVLDDESVNEKSVWEQVRYRVSWIKHQEAKRRREEEQAERERISYAQIDWHNFVVVETVDYQPWEVGSFPPPTSVDEVGARVLMQRRAETTGQPKPKMNLAPQAVVVTTDKDDDRMEGGTSNTQVEDMEEGSSEDEAENGVLSHPPQALGKPIMAVDAAPAVQQPSPALPAPGKVEVRKYDPKMAQAMKRSTDSEDFLVSPITGEKIPASKVQEHMRIGLLDPRWVEERDKQITARASEEQVFAPGQSIESSLKHLAERRTDIFGVGEEAAQEAAIGKKMGEEDRRLFGAADDRVQWDGHTSSVEAATRAARANITLIDQIEQIHRTKGLLPESSSEGIGPKVMKPTTPAVVSAAPVPAANKPPTMAVHVPVTAPTPLGAAVASGAHALPVVSLLPQATPLMLAPQPFYMPPQHAPLGFNNLAHIPVPPDDVMDEPMSKKIRSAEDNLIPEAEFLSLNPSPVTFKVSVPNMADKPEWNLNGQTLDITLPLSDTVSVIKAKLHDELSMPPGKQKLQMDNIFFKDSNTLAYYNITPGSLVFLQIKERGGRKK